MKPDRAEPALPFDILVEGRFVPGEVVIVYEPHARATSAELERRIETAWQAQCEQARASGRRLFNGELLRYVQHTVRDGAFHLTVGPTCYRDFVGTNLCHGADAAALGWDRFANPVGTTATLLTSDGLIVYGRRSDRVAWHGGHVHTFGGALEAVDLGADGRVDAFTAVRRELREEAGLAAEDIAGLVCVGMIRDREIHQPELLFEARLGLTLEGLMARMSRLDVGDEHAGLACVADRPELIVPFLQARGPVAPVAVGALLLHGGHRWGDAWLRKAAVELQWK